jgi:hypothetical protein
MRPKSILLVLAMIALGLCAWAPWITQDTASMLTQAQFNKAWYGIADGCGSYGNNMATHDFHKIPFGANITIDYQCGLVMPNSPPLQTTVYVTFFGVAFGYPEP